MKHIGNVFFELDIYKPYRIKDKMTSIENKSHTRNISYGSTNITIKLRKDFIHVLGISKSPILVYN